MIVNSTVEYDSYGNIISENGFTYHYNDLQELETIYYNGQLQANYTYDMFGERIKKVEYVNETAVTTYYIDDIYAYTTANNSASTTLYYYAHNIRVGEESNGTKLYYHPDYLGSADVITNSSGGVVYKADYLPFGISLNKSNQLHGFTGQQQDASGLVYMHARYFSPATSRFLQPDSMLPNVYDPQQLNRYSYARNNPIMYTDPTGHWLNVAIGAGLGFLGGFFGSLATQYFESNSVTQISMSSAFTSGMIGGGAGALIGGTLGLAATIMPTAYYGAMTAITSTSVGTMSAVGPEIFAGTTSSLISGGYTGTTNLMSGRPIGSNMQESIGGGYVNGLVGAGIAGAGSYAYSYWPQQRSENSPAFSNNKELISHFYKKNHGVDMGYDSPQSYQEGARTLIQTDLSDNIGGRIRMNGDLLKINKENGNFAILAEDRATIKTYFVPNSNPEKSYQYYLKQR